MICSALVGVMAAGLVMAMLPPAGPLSAAPLAVAIESGASGLRHRVQDDLPGPDAGAAGVEPKIGIRNRRLIQGALKHLGFYNSPIDGTFGTSTRRSIQAYQRSTGQRGTGFLTTDQIIQLFLTAKREGQILVARALAEADRLAREKAEQEQLAREQAEQEQLAREQAEQEQLAREQAEQEQLAREQAEQEQLAREQAKREQLAREQAKREQLAREQAKREQLAREQAKREQLAREQAKREQLAREQAKREQLAREQAEQEQLARESLARAQAEAPEGDAPQSPAKGPSADTSASERPLPDTAMSEPSPTAVPSADTADADSLDPAPQQLLTVQAVPSRSAQAPLSILDGTAGPPAPGEPTSRGAIPGQAINRSERRVIPELPVQTAFQPAARPAAFGEAGEWLPTADRPARPTVQAAGQAGTDPVRTMAADRRPRAELARRQTEMPGPVDRAAAAAAQTRTTTAANAARPRRDAAAATGPAALRPGPGVLVPVEETESASQSLATTRAGSDAPDGLGGNDGRSATVIVSTSLGALSFGSPPDDAPSDTGFPIVIAAADSQAVSDSPLQENNERAGYLPSTVVPTRPVTIAPASPSESLAPAGLPILADDPGVAAERPTGTDAAGPALPDPAEPAPDLAVTAPPEPDSPLVAADDPNLLTAELPSPVSDVPDPGRDAVAVDVATGGTDIRAVIGQVTGQPAGRVSTDEGRRLGIAARGLDGGMDDRPLMTSGLRGRSAPDGGPDGEADPAIVASLLASPPGLDRAVGVAPPPAGLSELSPPGLSGTRIPSTDMRIGPGDAPGGLLGTRPTAPTPASPSSTLPSTAWSPIRPADDILVPPIVRSLPDVSGRQDSDAPSAASRVGRRDQRDRDLAKGDITEGAMAAAGMLDAAPTRDNWLERVEGTFTGYIKTPDSQGEFPVRTRFDYDDGQLTGAFQSFINGLRRRGRLTEVKVIDDRTIEMTWRSLWEAGPVRFHFSEDLSSFNGVWGRERIESVPWVGTRR